MTTYTRLLLAVSVMTGCAVYQPHEVKLPGGKHTTALGTDDELYLRLLRLRRGNKHKALHDTLSRELDRRKEDDVEGCIHAAGDLATVSIERGWLESATMALESLRLCHARLAMGKVGEAFVTEDHVKLWGLSGASSPTIRCNTGHCKVRMVSNYFSWSRPLEDYKVAGEQGQRKGLAVMGAIIGTPLLIGPLNGYRNTRGAFRGTVRYERPPDPEKHKRKLIASLTEAAQRVGFTAEARNFHYQAAGVLASVGNDATIVLRYRLQAAFAYSDLNEATKLIARHAGTTAKIEALDYVGLVAKAPASLDRAGAMHVVEPYYYDPLSADPSEEAAARYLALFPVGERSAEVRAIEHSLVEFRTKVAGKPRALVSFWNRHRDDPLGKLAIKPLQALVKEKVQVLDTHIFVTNGDGNWVNDIAEELRPNGAYGGERFNAFISGKLVNRSNVELDVRLTCKFLMLETVTMKAFIVSTTQTEPLTKISSFVAHLPPKKSKTFVCLLKNQSLGGGISLEGAVGIEGRVSFRDPPVYLEPHFEEQTISSGELAAQEELEAAFVTRGNVATKVDPRSQPIALGAPVPDATTPRLLIDDVRPKLSTPATQFQLPEELTLEDIKDGTREAKEAAVRRCGALARPGESVSIKLSISGSDGTVIKAVPVGGSQDAGLAECVARELKAATFKRVQKTQSGAQIKVTF